MKKTGTVNYTYSNAPIPGGGFVTGCLFHCREKGLVYLRTDIGGAYRYDNSRNKWLPLCDSAHDETLCLSSPLSIAIDPENTEMLYMACGVGRQGFLAISHNRGKTFALKPIPAVINGNAIGRGSGERLLLAGDKLFFGSQTEGLMISADKGDNWEKAELLGEREITFIDFIPPETIIAGTTGENNAIGDTRGHSVYISYDMGESFSPLPIVNPEPYTKNQVHGFTGVRGCYDGKYYYMLMNETAPGCLGKWNAYSCDCGRLLRGKVLRCSVAEGKLSSPEDITPDKKYFCRENGEEKKFGFGGIDFARGGNGRLVLTTVCRSGGDLVFASEDRGKSWKVIISRNDPGNFKCHTPYMKPEYNNNGGIIHWMSDIKLDPFDSTKGCFTSGTGLFQITDLWTDKISYQDFCEGIEETVHLGVYSPPTGKNRVLDAVGDLGGFAFRDINYSCENSFADENNNRYITIMNIDYAENNPDFIAATPRGNWNGTTKGGVIISDDGGDSWIHTSQPLGITDEIDQLIEIITLPNVNSGWVSVSADGKNMVWCVGIHSLSMSSVIYSDDKGKSWKKCRIFDISGNEITNESRTVSPAESQLLMKVFSDRVKPEIMYGFGERGQIYLSRDGGKSFYQKHSPLPPVNLGLIEGRRVADIRVQPGKVGRIWLALGEFGLFALDYSFDTDSFSLKRLTREFDRAFAIGFGKGRKVGDPDTLYFSGDINREYALWRSEDEGESWQRINNHNQMYGRIHSISGDAREFGRVYIASGMRGLVTGIVS